MSMVKGYQEKASVWFRYVIKRKQTEIFSFQISALPSWTSYNFPEPLCLHWYIEDNNNYSCFYVDEGKVYKILL